jgi:aminoglycoside phosphotransferase (APT) family kinase protein
MAREHRILSSLWQAYPLAPRSFFFCEDRRVLGTPFQILEYREGILVRGQLPLDLIDHPGVGPWANAFFRKAASGVDAK